MSRLYATPICFLFLFSAPTFAQRFQTVYETTKAPASAAVPAAHPPKAPPKPPPAYFRPEPGAESPLRLRWRTTPDQTGWTFTIERSPDQQEWVTLGQVSLADSTGVRTYAFTDESPVATAHYRLTYLDKQGKTTYTRWLSVLNLSKANRGVTYCWFDNALLTIGFNEAVMQFPALVVLYDQAGQMLCADACPQPTAEYLIDLTTIKPPPGRGTADKPVTLQVVDANHRVLLTRRIDVAKK